MRKIEGWTVPKIWDDEECFILGGGPSLSIVPFDQLSGKRVIAVNQAYTTGHWDALFFGDAGSEAKPGWFEHNEQALLDWGGLVVTKRHQYANRSWVRVAKCDSRDGLSDTPGVLNWNRSSGACAITLAIALGARRVILLGFDGKLVNGRQNFHDEYAKWKLTKPTERHYSIVYRLGFSAIAKALPKRGIEVVNATPNSALDMFPIVDPKHLFENMETVPC